MRPSGTAMPARASSCFAWYSWSFTDERGYRRGMRRVSVVGGSCSGKTTFARALAEILDVSFVELDALNWEANWTMADVATFQQRIRAATAGEAWVVDGNYGGRGARDILWAGADNLWWPGPPPLLTPLRLVAPTTHPTRPPEARWGGDHET